MLLKGIRALITGGGHGLGRGIAEALAAQGASLLVCGRNQELLKDTERALGATGASVFVQVCDVTDEAAVAATLEAAENQLGGVDLLINNAGTAPTAPLSRMQRELWDGAMAVNATGPFLFTRACLAGMLEQGRGRIVNIASTAGITGGPYLAAYSASKHALIGLTRATAAEFGARGISANALCPAYVDTAMTRDAVEVLARRKDIPEEEALQALLATADQQRLLTVGEVAAWVVHMAGPAGDGMNGQLVVLDGGSKAP